MMDVRQRFGLQAMPFTKEIALEDGYAHDGLEHAVTSLVAAVKGRRCAVLTGDSGVGKTFALRALRERLPNGRFHLHYIPNASLNLRDFYRQLSSVLGLEARATAAALFRQVSAQLETLATAQRIHPVLLLDEAHLLPLRVLENLHILLNFKWDSAALLSIVLIGLPELRERLRRNVLSSLATRLPVRAELAPLPRACVAAYLNHRMTRAGCAQQVFGEEAALLIAEATGRIPAKINTLADHCLDVAGEGRSQIVDGPMVQEARKRCAEAIQ